MQTQQEDPVVTHFFVPPQVKTSSPVDFSRVSSSGGSSIPVLSKITKSRKDLLFVLGQRNVDVSELTATVVKVDALLKEYLSLLRVFVDASASKSGNSDAVGIFPSTSPSAPPINDGERDQISAEENNASYDSTKHMAESQPSANSNMLVGDSAVRKLLSFQWVQLFGPRPEIKSDDAAFEYASVLFAAGISLLFLATKAHNAAQPGEPGEQLKKLSYNTFLQAAGIFAAAEKIVTSLSLPALDGVHDVKPALLKAMSTMALAQAQEITVDRAISKNNAQSLICKLARDTCLKFQMATLTLDPEDSTTGGRLGKLRFYLRYKTFVYESVAFEYAGLMLAEKKNESGSSFGDAVAAALRAVVQGKMAAQESKKYAEVEPKTSNKGRGNPKEHVAAIIARCEASAAKLSRQNDTIYYDKVPSEPPEPPTGPGLVKPIDFVFPQQSPDWTAVYDQLAALTLRDSANKASSAVPATVSNPALLHRTSSEGAASTAASGDASSASTKSKSKKKDDCSIS